MIKKLVLAVSFILALASLVSADTPVSINGKLKVTGLQLTNECNVPVQLRGVSTHGLQWFGSCYTDQSLDYAANVMHADSVRLAMYTAQNGYLYDPAYFTSLVDTLVDKIGARGMYAIIDWHILTDNDPNANSLAAHTFWTHEATQHAGKKYVLYEICNEPNGSVTWANIKTYADYIIPAIRAIDPDTVIICGTPNYSQLGWDVVYNQLSYPNVMYTFHFYAGSHNISMVTPFLDQIPIFCTEWGPSNSSGSGGDDYANAQAFLDIYNGTDKVNNPTGVKISWNEWTFSSASESSAELAAGTCPNGPWDLSNLTTAGNFVYTNINNPAKTYYCGTLTPTITGTPPTQTITPTMTITPTPLPWDLIYDGDTAGYTLADGVAASNSWTNAQCTPIGTIIETTGGLAGNGMKLSYASAHYWEGHSWTKTKAIGVNNYIQFDVKTVSGSVTQLLFTLDRGANRVNINANTTWKTMSYPLSTFYSSMPPSIGEFDFVNNSNSDYTVMVDNIRLVAVPSPTVTPTRTPTPTWTVSNTCTVTPTITVTFTITPTSSITKTLTITPTVTLTSTITLTPTAVARFVNITSWKTFPDPCNGRSRITFSYDLTGFANKVTITLYSFGDRKFRMLTAVNQPAGTDTLEWTPEKTLANGLYYYAIEAVNGKHDPVRHVGAFVVIK